MIKIQNDLHYPAVIIPNAVKDNKKEEAEHQMKAIFTKYETEMKSESAKFMDEQQTLKKQMKDQMNEFQADLAKQKRDLVFKQTAWEQFEKEQKKRFIIPPGIVELDVGGKEMKVLLATLTKFPDSILAKMFNGLHAIPHTKEGRPFIDRNPEQTSA